MISKMIVTVIVVVAFVLMMMMMMTTPLQLRQVMIDFSLSLQHQYELGVESLDEEKSKPKPSLVVVVRILAPNRFVKNLSSLVASIELLFSALLRLLYSGFSFYKSKELLQISDYCYSFLVFRKIGSWRYWVVRV